MNDNEANNFFLLAILIFSCDSQKPIDYSKLETIQDLNEKVLVDFYENVLDTLLGENYLYNLPNLKMKLSRFKGLGNSDQDFFKQQIEKFNSFQWDNYLLKEKLLSKSELDTIFKNDPIKGWGIFNGGYGDNCICSMSIPLFTADLKKAYVDFGTQCADLWGLGEVYIFELIEGKWTFVDYYHTWAS